MTEAEWLACDDPKPMLEFLRDKASDRKLRLFACACCRRVERLLTQPRICKSLNVAELYADGGSSSGSLDDANRILAGPFLRDFDGVEAVEAATSTPVNAALAAQITANVAALEDAPPHWMVPAPEELRRQRVVQVALLRDLFGDSSHQTVIQWVWRTADVTAPARSAYEVRPLSGELDLACLAVLADALEDAGCTDAAILEHLRSPGPHVRGCWALDLIVGKQ
jgi:hypothetical protein